MKIGIEIHQRLDTSKLYCACESRISEDGKPDILIKPPAAPGIF